MNINSFKSGNSDITVEIEGFGIRDQELMEPEVNSLWNLISLCLQTSWFVLEQELDRKGNRKVPVEKLYEQINSGDINPIPNSPIKVQKLSKQRRRRFITLLMNFLKEFLKDIRDDETTILPKETTLTISWNNRKSKLQ